MGSSDLTNAIIILVIFASMHLFLTISIGIARIKNNWEEYKCKPGVIPFASVFGYNTIDNFNQCVEDLQANYMGIFLEPIYGTLNSMSSMGGIFTHLFENIKGGLLGQHLQTLNVKEDVINRTSNVLTEINVIFISIVDSFSKIAGIITVLFQLMVAGIETGESVWNELPGTVIRKILL